MKIVFSLMIGILVMLNTDVWCQPPQPSGPGDTLRRSQDTMEFYKLEREMQKGQQQLKQKANTSEEKSGNQNEFEINEDDNDVVEFTDQKQPENEK